MSLIEGDTRIEQAASRTDGDSLLVSRWSLYKYVKRMLTVDSRMMRFLADEEIAKGTLLALPFARILVKDFPLTATSSTYTYSSFAFVSRVIDILP